jgi:hypothetical protein
MCALALPFLLVASQAVAQNTEQVIKSCPVLTNADAAAVLGPGTIFASGAEARSGATRISLLCEFVQGERTLTLTASKTIGTRDVWEQLRQLSNAALEPGLGDYAYSEMQDGHAHVLVVKGPLTLELRTGGKGGAPTDVAKVREAAKKAVVKL